MCRLLPHPAAGAARGPRARLEVPAGPEMEPRHRRSGCPSDASFELGEGCARLSHRTLSGKARLRQLGAPNSPSRLVLFKG